MKDKLTVGRRIKNVKRLQNNIIGALIIMIFSLMCMGVSSGYKNHIQAESFEEGSYIAKEGKIVSIDKDVKGNRVLGVDTGDKIVFNVKLDVSKGDGIKYVEWEEYTRPIFSDTKPTGVIQYGEVKISKNTNTRN